MIDTDDPIVWKSGEDGEMIKAIESAQATFEQFLDILKSNSELEESFVKLMIPGLKQGVVAEHLFVGDLFFDAHVLFGIIDSEPQYNDKYKCGDKIQVRREQISDWMYVAGGKAQGGFTFRVMWEAFSDEDKARYGWDPPFCWMDLN